MGDDTNFMAEYEDDVKVSEPVIKDNEVIEDDKPKEVEEKEKEEDVDTVREEHTVRLKALQEEEESEEEEVSDESPAEVAARQQGWVPQTEWDGDESLWRSAEVFLERGEYFKTMHSQKREINKLTGQMDNLISMQKKIREDERAKVIKELNADKLEALQEGEYEKIIQIDEDLAEAQKQEEVPEEGAVKPEGDMLTPEMEETVEALETFINANDWYKKDLNMRQYADVVGGGYRKLNPEANVDEVLVYIKDEVEAKYPEHFGGKPASPARRSPVGSGTGTKPNSGKSKLPKFSDLNQMQQDLCRRFVADGAFQSEDEYIAELVKIGDI